MSKDFELIEHHLVENVDSESLKDNFSNLEEWAACEDSHLCGMRFGSSKPIAALERLIELYHRTRRPDRCFVDDHEMLSVSRDSAGVDYEWYTAYPKKYRVRILLEKLGHRLAELCMKTRAKEFKYRLKQLDSEQLAPLKLSFKKLADYTFEAMGQELVGNDEKSKTSYLISQYFDSGVGVGGLRRFMNFVEQNANVIIPANGSKVEKKKVRKLVDDFLENFFRKPCCYYLQTTYKYAEELIDFVFLRIRAKYSELDTDDELYLPLGEYFMCKKFIEKAETSVNVLMNCKTNKVLCQ